MIKRLLTETIAYILIKAHGILKREHNVLSVYFHNPSRKVFKNTIEWLKKNGYSFISTNDLYQIINNRHANVPKYALITFDDGWKDNLALLDIIETYELPVTIFIPTEAIVEGNYWFEYAAIKDQEKYTGIKSKEQFKQLPGAVFIEKVKTLKSNYSLKRSCLDLSQLREISHNKYITIGSHSVTHPILNKLSKEDQKFELINSKQILSKWLDKDISFLAYPNGDFNNSTIEIAQECGYKLGFTTMLGAINAKDVNPYIIPRHAMNDNGGYYENISKILGIWQKLYFKNTLLYRLFK